MTYRVTPMQIAALAPRANGVESIVQAINETTQRYGIDQSLRRLRYFVAQSLHETKGYTSWEEDLYYTTPQRLVTVWPSRYTLDPQIAAQGKKRLATEYVRNPRAIAEYSYGGRMGNRPEGSGDGYKYIGRGAFHLTGAEDYGNYGQAVYGNRQKFLDDPQAVAKMPDAMLSAGWYWDRKDFNALADSDSFTRMTDILNGSTATVPERLPVLRKCNQIIV